MVSHACIRDLRWCPWLRIACREAASGRGHVSLQMEASDIQWLRSCRLPVQVFKHKPKKHYQRKTGHRQPLTKFLVTKIAPDS